MCLRPTLIGSCREGVSCDSDGTLNCSISYNVLLVVDDDAVRDMLTVALEGKGFKC